MIIQPWGGRHANLLYRLWPQRTYQLTGGSNTRLREIVLSVLGRKVRAHMGREPDVFTHAEPVSSVIRKDVVRPLEGYAQGETAGAIRAAGGCLIEAETPAKFGPAFALLRCRWLVLYGNINPLTDPLDWLPESRITGATEVAPAHSKGGTDG